MDWQLHKVLAIYILLAMGPGTIAHSAPNGSAEPAHPQSSPELAAFAAKMAVFANNLDRVQHFTGTVKPHPLDVGIRDPLPRDLYFQTRAIWEKTDAFLFEIKRRHGPPRSSTATQPDLDRSRDDLEAASQMLWQIMEELKITPLQETVTGGNISFSEVSNTLIELDRQLNLLLEQPISPSDVYQELTLAIGYTSRLLARYPNAIRIPVEPAFEPGKQPKDVYRRLTECLHTLAAIFNTLKLPILTISPRTVDLETPQPNDTHLITILIVSQLTSLYEHFGIQKPPPQPLYPGVKFPTDNYQRAGLLLAQLQQLAAFVSNDTLTPAAVPRSTTTQ